MKSAQQDFHTKRYALQVWSAILGKTLNIPPLFNTKISRYFFIYLGDQTGDLGILKIEDINLTPHK